MPSTLVRTSTRSIAFLIALAAMLNFTLGARAETINLIVTANLERVFPALTPDERLVNSDLEFEAVLTRLIDADPEAFRIDLGRHQSITHTNETGYAVPVWQVFDFNKYDVVNLDARESMTATDGIFGLEMAPESFRRRTIATAVSNRNDILDLPLSRTIVREPREGASSAPSLTVVSLTDVAAARGMGGRTAETKRLALSEAFEAISDATSAERTVVAIASGLNFIPRFPSRAASPDVLFVFGEKGAPRRIDNPAGPGIWMIPAPSAGNLLKVKLKTERGRLTAAPTVEIIPYLPEGLHDQLIQFPRPRVGVLIPNVEDVMRQFFDVARGATDLDRFPVDLVSDLTETPPNVYTIPTSDGVRRIYRVTSVMPYYKRALPIDPNWPPMDMLVILDDQHQFQRLVSRIEFPVGGTSTTVLEDINRRRGTDPYEWQVDSTSSPGVTEVWQWVAQTVRLVAEVDRRLFVEE